MLLVLFYIIVFDFDLKIHEGVEKFKSVLSSGLCIYV